MTEEHFYLGLPDGFKIYCIYTQPEHKARACVLLIHGAKEHTHRYEDLRAYLSEAGFATISCDLRGHGRSTDEAHPLGTLLNQDILIRDLEVVAEQGLQKSGAHELYVFGHSMGSILARSFVLQSQLKPSKVILSGTVQPFKQAFLPVGLARLICTLKGKKSYSAILKQVVDSPQNEWVNSCPQALKAYREDPFCCGYRYVNESVLNLIEMTGALNNLGSNLDSRYQPEILSITGAEDIRITGGKAGVEMSLEILSTAGFSKLSYKLYPGLKHELVIGAHNGEALEDIVAFYAGESSKVQGLKRSRDKSV